MALDDMPIERLGDGPLDEATREQMIAVSRALDGFFNGGARGEDRQVGFVLLLFPYGEREGRCNYVSNGANRHDIAILLKEQAARFEGQPEAWGTA